MVAYAQGSNKSRTGHEREAADKWQFLIWARCGMAPEAIAFPRDAESGSVLAGPG